MYVFLTKEYISTFHHQQTVSISVFIYNNIVSIANRRSLENCPLITVLVVVTVGNLL